VRLRQGAVHVPTGIGLASEGTLHFLDVPRSGAPTLATMAGQG
jgi:hypothetical protein